MKKLEVIKNNGYLIVLSCCLIALYALFFPALENPDEIEHLSRILYEKTLWGEILHSIGNIFFDVNSLSFIHEAMTNKNFSYVRNDFVYLPVDTPIEYYFLKLINVFAVLAFFFLIVKIFSGNKLVLLWPSATYYMSILTSEGLAYALMLGSSTNTKMKVFLALCIGVILIFLDRSIIIFCTFLLIKFSLITISKRDFILMKKYSIYLLLISLIIYITSIINFNYILEFITINEVRNVAIYSHNLMPNYLNQIIVFIASFMMLSGSMSFYPTVFFYAYMTYLLFNIFNNKTTSCEVNDQMCSIFIGLSLLLIYSSFIPQLSHFRYYLFLVPPIVFLFTFRYSSKHLFLLTLVAFTYNTLGLNLMIFL
ncbi:hypothetical protein OAS07_02630 [Candidatus Thioglobus sp.]|nr:hypothetical protein [Candidatus Thioglobus sp.]MDC1165313.1 hypothetical protein [Candidatus Thioglobus sp.]